MATYVDIDKLTYNLEVFNHRYVYDLPLQENDTYLEYSTLKTKPYKTITSEDRQRLSELTNELYDYIFFADDINNYASAVINMQKFISEDFPDYVNEVIGTLWTNYEDAITNINKKKDEVDNWWSTVKLSLSVNKSFIWSDWLNLPNVNYYSTSFNGNTITQTLMFKDTTFGTYTTNFLSNGNIEETIVITDPYDGVTLYNRTKTTVFNADGTIKETVKDN